MPWLYYFKSLSIKDCHNEAHMFLSARFHTLTTEWKHKVPESSCVHDSSRDIPIISATVDQLWYLRFWKNYSILLKPWLKVVNELSSTCLRLKKFMSVNNLYTNMSNECTCVGMNKFISVNTSLHKYVTRQLAYLEIVLNGHTVDSYLCW